MKDLKNRRNELLVRGFMLGTEFAVSVLALIFLGYFLGGMFGKSMALIGMLLGAFLGFVVGLYRLIKRAG